MQQQAIGFTLGALLFQHLPELPSVWWLLLCVPLISHRHLLPLPMLQMLLVGILWSLAYAWITQPEAIQPALLGQDIQITGVIEEIPRQRPASSSFLVRATSIKHAAQDYHGSWRLRLSWYRNPPALISGDQWQLQVRLKQAHGYMNPGGFDYEGWLYTQGVRYTGYVRSGQHQAQSRWPGLHRVRQLVSQKLADMPLDQRAMAVIRALVVGDRNDLTAADRALFAATGTSHLMAISGLHVGLVAGLLFLSVRWAWCRVPVLCGRWPANVAAAAGGMLGGCCMRRWPVFRYLPSAH